MPSYFVRVPRLIRDYAGFSLVGNDVVNNEANGPYSFAMGKGSRTRQTGEFAQSSTRFTDDAEAQFRRVLHRGETTMSAAFTEIFINGVSERLFVDRYASYYFETCVLGYGFDGTFAGASMSWLLQGVLTKPTEDGVGPAVLYGFSNTIIGQTDPALVWAVDGVVGGITNEDFVITVQGDALTSIRWMAKTEIMEVSTPP